MFSFDPGFDANDVLVFQPDVRSATGRPLSALFRVISGSFRQMGNKTQPHHVDQTWPEHFYQYVATCTTEGTLSTSN
jgi:hypothetical protein